MRKKWLTETVSWRDLHLETGPKEHRQSVAEVSRILTPHLIPALPRGLNFPDRTQEHLDCGSEILRFLPYPGPILSSG